MKQQEGFTLIELLIVVAIIAILAGIGLSNYMDAQARSRAAVVANDLRVLAGALEAYRVDHNRYPPAAGVGAAWNEFGDFAEPFSARLYALTTPVAFITSVPTDKLAADSLWGYPDSSIADSYDYVDADAVPERGTALSSGAEWRLASAGPDRYQAYGGRPVGDKEANARGVDYDPTNGTRSSGDIVRVGPACYRYGDPLDPANPRRPGIVRAPRYVEQWQ